MKRIAWILGTAVVAVTALLDFFPTLSVTLRDVQVGGPAGMPDAPIISMERVRGTVRLLPLVIGRVEIASFTVVRPLIRLVRNVEGDRNWEFDSGAAALQLAFAGDVPLGDFVVEEGTVVYENRPSLDVKNGSVPLFGIAEIAAASGTGSQPAPRYSPVESVLVGLSFAGGTAIVEQCTVAAPGFTAQARGRIELADGNLGLNGTVEPTGEAPVEPIAFTIDGSLARPAARRLALAN